jgi:hypothetical protein
MIMFVLNLKRLNLKKKNKYGQVKFIKLLIYKMVNINYKIINI